MTWRMNMTVSVKEILGINDDDKIHFGGDAYGFNTKKKKHFIVVGTTYEMLVSVSDML
jgi:hypothetical protein